MSRWRRERRRGGRLRAHEHLQLEHRTGGIQVAGGAIFAKFSRDDEAQADAAGVEEKVRASINPNGMPRCSRSCRRAASQPGALDAWFADHPLEKTASRTRAQIQKYDAAVLRRLRRTVARSRTSKPGSDRFRHLLNSGSIVDGARAGI